MKLGTSIRDFIFELSHELANDLSLRILGNEAILEKLQKCMGTQPSVSLSCRNKYLALLLKLLNFSHNILQRIVITKYYLKT